MTWIKQVNPLSFVTRALSADPWYVILYVTTRCNQRCNMCFYWEKLNTLGADEEFSLEEFEKIAKNLPNLYQLTLTGGEPTLRSDLIDIIRIFHRVSGVNRITIPTNGFYVDKLVNLATQAMTEFPDLILSINISIDGIGEVHDKIRKLPNSFKNLEESYKQLSRIQEKFSNLHIATASVITVSNKDSIVSMLEYIKDHFDIGQHGLMLARGDVQSDDGAPIADQDFVKFLTLHREMVQNQSALSDAVADQYTESRIETLVEGRMKDPCKAGKKLLVIKENGDLYPCEILDVLASEGKTDAPELGDFCFGNLRETGFDINVLMNTPRGDSIRQFIADNRCWCTFECAQINNFALNPRSYFRIAKRYLTNAL
jgi:MoaA/NifB/PqqE/SkfB family radical SAM enzyme